MRVGSLFAGIGGFDIAAERAGMEVAWQSEVDPAASQVLEHRWPGLNLGDIHDITIGEGSDGAAAVDVLTGGFPCQDYSIAGARRGLAGDRGALWWQYHRLITEGRPQWVIGENVPGLLSSRGGRDFGVIIESLVECGYGVTWAVLDAQYFGVAQRRRRVFIVAHSGGRPRPEILALGEGLFGHPEPRREAGQDPAGAITTSTFGSGGADDNTARAGHLIPGADPMPTLPASMGKMTPGHNRDDFIVGFNWQSGQDHLGIDRDLVGALHAGQTPAVFGIQGDGGTSKGSGGDGWKLDESYTLNTIDRHAVAYDQLNDTLGDEDVHHTLRATGKSSTGVLAFAENQRAEVRDLGDVAGTVTEPSGKNGTRVTSPTVRRLTPLECERLQGFPDGWTATPGNSDSQRYRQLGNAVAVPVVEWILTRIAAAS